VLNAWCAKVGRDPAAIERTASIDRIDLNDVEKLVDTGAQHIIYELGAPFDLRPVERLLAWRDRQG